MTTAIQHERKSHPPPRPTCHTPPPAKLSRAKYDNCQLCATEASTKSLKAK